ncbi:hypothetical protein LEP1GSC151_3366 [Leptospira interrogans serovar Grippotyphosa str. LT2186]|nr:hypothetical protein LEP1GSC151_3366 [Leptospira interrogans serovar Grippotyphosa str. LT2186]EMG22320.1 hypothetical protein LEP1GSC150_0572 [Leptospira interrogans serovar Copenhageni str. LT2050]EMM82819.1 hypothetical protein LEP1GSC037_4892 [Leptospira interrogans str. 2006001854]EMP08463.1 hypothetical protein LEP1GSC124_1152 [Leptospira interrogans serovar Pyrogenes str. 200701872]EMY23846.1 hypothetical protein LEP1GSC115_3233 [Leptospira interrogans serovar Australis str. 200703203
MFRLSKSNRKYSYKKLKELDFTFRFILDRKGFTFTQVFKEKK